MFAILAYAPFLPCLPALSVVGLVFVVIRRGLVVVLGGLYHALVGFSDLLGLAVGRRRRAGASRVRPNTSPENVSRVNLVAARERGTSRTGKMARGRLELASIPEVLLPNRAAEVVLRDADGLVARPLSLGRGPQG